MPHTVLAVGAAALTASGCVWYIPAVTDLRAGDDRPRSVRLSAIACLAWWSSLAGAGIVLLTPAVWQLAAAIAAAGAVSGTALRLAAAADHRSAQREETRYWAEVLPGPVPSPDRRRPQVVMLAWLVAGVSASSVAAASLVVSAREDTPTGPALATAACGSVGFSLVILLVAVTRARS
ncbi:hypothetical protein ACFC1R_36420 [Kitasatospora sp. NPDC056138]|uniref:hypothetical protein n=1 Tax=Kitasatospora sp. NPDC056138 TaxID=3345724 RepID=UPI0035E05BE6